MIDFDKVLFRASANGDIMAKGSEITDIQKGTLTELITKSKEPKGLTAKQSDEMLRLIEKRDNPQLAQTCIRRLIKMYALELGRKEEVKSKYMEKGILQEDEAITLYSRLTGTFWKKNTEQLANKYVCGTPDLGNEERIQDSTVMVDTKCAWSLITYLDAKFKDEVKSDYEWQGDTYMALVPKCEEFRVAHCLVNAPGSIIMNEKKKLLWTMDGIDPEVNPDYKEKCQQVERNHIFDIHQFVTSPENAGFDFDNDLDTWQWDIPKEGRMFQYVIKRNSERIEKLYHKVTRCRKWMSENFK